MNGQRGARTAVLRVDVVEGPFAGYVVDRLRRLDQAGLTQCRAISHRPRAALVINISPADVSTRDGAGEVADVLLCADDALDEQIERLWHARVEPFALSLARPPSAGPAVLRLHDPSFAMTASRLLERIRAALTDSGFDDGSWTYDHIGSTAVPELRAKPLLDLQIGAEYLPAECGSFDAVLGMLGFVPAVGARPDSPGVYSDWVKDPDLVSATNHQKRLYVRQDPVHPTILHVRKRGSPWWSYAVLFRDWLRANPSGRRGYEAAKIAAANAHADDADYDDYTRNKAAFFDQVQREYERYGANSEYQVRR